MNYCGVIFEGQNYYSTNVQFSFVTPITPTDNQTTLVNIRFNRDTNEIRVMPLFGFIILQRII